MKLRVLSILSLITLLLFASCKEKPKNGMEKYRRQPQMEMTTNDTAAVKQLVTQYLDLLKDGQLEQAVDMLNILKEEKIAPLPERQRQDQLMVLKAFPVYSYQIDRYSFYKETDSEVSYYITVQDPAKFAEPAKMNLMIRPVRENGKWYLTLANTRGEDKASELDN